MYNFKYRNLEKRILDFEFLDMDINFQLSKLQKKRSKSLNG